MVCIYEGTETRNLAPLVDLKPVFELRCGWRTLIEKFQRVYPGERFVLWVRDDIAELVKERYPDCAVNAPVALPAIFIYAGTVLTRALPVKGKDTVFYSDKRVVAVRLSRERRKVINRYQELSGLIPGLYQEEVAVRTILYPWELIKYHPEELERELGESCGDRVVVKPGARVWRGAFIVTETGPVYLGQEAEVRPGSVVYGPCYIGPGTIVDGAIVRSGCSFGPRCWIGGEVDSSIFQGYANKHHEGFIGHSYVGEWVNLGALTTCSDLKNNYQPVRMKAGTRRRETGMLKLGCVLGDHAKTAIGTLIPTGAVLGTFANWFAGGMMPGVLPAFSWGRRAHWRIEEMIECARRVMARRNVVMSPAYEKVLRRAYQRSV